MPNGNTLVCSGASVRIFKISRDGAIAADDSNPFGGDFKVPDHARNARPLSPYRVDRYAPTYPGTQQGVGANSILLP